MELLLFYPTQEFLHVLVNQNELFIGSGKEDPSVGLSYSALINATTRVAVTKERCIAGIKVNLEGMKQLLL